jgi:hypothetical protein
MCVTTERHSTVCGHKATYTKVCKKKGKSVFNIFRSKCAPSKQGAMIYELCHDCRRFWQAYGVDEIEATERTSNYRVQHKYYGPLSPHSFSNTRKPVLLRDGELETGDPVVHLGIPTAGPSEVPKRRLTERSVNRYGDPMESVLRARDYQEDLPRWMNRWTVGEASTSRPRSAESTVTLWPTAEDQDLTEPENTVEMHGGRGDNAGSGSIDGFLNDAFEYEGLATRLKATTVNPDGFELQPLGRPASVALRADGVERLHPARALPPRQIPRNLLPTPNTPDLDKPLPRAPRQGSPMPGRKFDSQNPERDLPANLYYPRAF